MSAYEDWERHDARIAESGKFWQQQFHNLRRNIGTV